MKKNCMDILFIMAIVILSMNMRASAGQGQSVIDEDGQPRTSYTIASSCSDCGNVVWFWEGRDGHKRNCPRYTRYNEPQPKKGMSIGGSYTWRIK